MGVGGGRLGFIGGMQVDISCLMYPSTRPAVTTIEITTTTALALHKAVRMASKRDGGNSMLLGLKQGFFSRAIFGKVWRCEEILDWVCIQGLDPNCFFGKLGRDDCFDIEIQVFSVWLSKRGCLDWFPLSTVY